MDRLKVALAGCGARGKQHLRVLAGLADVEIVAVCDPSAAAAARAAREKGIARTFSSIDELLGARLPVEAVVVAAPAHLNAQVALPCLERGLPVLLEKPPGLHSSETRRLREAAARTGAVAMVGWNRRFHPLVRRAVDAVRERGPVTQIVAEFHKSMTQAIKSGLYAESVLENIIFETPQHSIDLMRAIAGAEVAEVHSCVRRACAPYRDVHAALVVFTSGCVAQLVSNYTTDARLERYEIHGRDISAYLEGVTRGVIQADGTATTIEGHGDSGLTDQERYFVDCVRSGRRPKPPAADLDEAIKTMELTEAIIAGGNG